MCVQFLAPNNQLLLQSIHSCCSLANHKPSFFFLAPSFLSVTYHHVRPVQENVDLMTHGMKRYLKGIVQILSLRGNLPGQKLIVTKCLPWKGLLFRPDNHPVHREICVFIINNYFMGNYDVLSIFLKNRIQRWKGENLLEGRYKKRETIYKVMTTNGTNNKWPGSLGEDLPCVREHFKEEGILSWTLKKGKN